MKIAVFVPQTLYQEMGFRHSVDAAWAAVIEYVPAEERYDGTIKAITNIEDDTERLVRVNLEIPDVVPEMTISALLSDRFVGMDKIHSYLEIIDESRATGVPGRKDDTDEQLWVEASVEYLKVNVVKTQAFHNGFDHSPHCVYILQAFPEAADLPVGYTKIN